MSRLYDRIWQHGCHSLTGEHHPYGDELWQAQRPADTLVMEITNVSDYVASHWRWEDFLTAADIPNAVPPFWTGFYEARRPPWEFEGPTFSWGVLLNCIDIPYMQEHPEEFGIEASLSNVPVGAYWSILGFLYLENAPGKPFGYAISFQSFLSYEGGLIGEEPIEVGLPPNIYDAPREMGEWLIANNQKFFQTALLANAFSHCKNVELRKHNPPRAERRRAEREGVPSPVVYRTLNIDPMQNTLREQGRIEKIGMARALHICRGHFATYSPEKPLFGKLTGTFWKPQHIKGSKKHGEVIKDYEVKTP